MREPFLVVGADMVNMRRCRRRAIRLELRGRLVPGGVELKSSRTRKLALARCAALMFADRHSTVAVQLIRSVVFDVPKLLVRPARIETAPR